MTSLQNGDEKTFASLGDWEVKKITKCKRLNRLENDVVNSGWCCTLVRLWLNHHVFVEVFFLEPCSLVTWLCVMWALLILCQRLRLPHKYVAVPKGIQPEGELSIVATVAICVLHTSCWGQVYFSILLSRTVWDVALPQRNDLVELSSLGDFMTTCLGESVSCEIWDKALYI